MASSAADLISKILRHERFVVAAGVALLVALSWWFLATGAGMDHAMHMGMQPPLAALIVMWWLMMIAMMLPSAAPTILLYARVRQQRGTSGQVAQPWIFLSGYVLVWLLFSLIAAAAQRLVAGPGMALLHPDVASGLLIGAGLYQLSPIKNACLRQCRAPTQFLSRYWRPGVGGAVRLGVLHGAYCVGCCWMLMALLFVVGVMNFAWIAALTVIVGLERLVPRGEWVARASGVALVGWGLIRLAGS